MMRESRGHDSDADFSAILARWARNQYGYIAKIFRLTSQTTDRQLTDSNFRVTSWRACTCATAGLRSLRLVPECINALRDLPHLGSCFRHCCSRHCQWIFPLFLLHPCSKKGLEARVKPASVIRATCRRQRARRAGGNSESTSLL